MKEQSLKKWVIKRMSIYGAMLLVMISIFLVLRYERVSLSNNNRTLIGQMGEEKNRLAGLKNRASEVANATRLWNSLPEANKNVNGLLIDKSKTIFDKNAKLYYINNLAVNFSTPNQLAGEYKKQTTAVMSSDVTMTFKGLSDQYIVSFVQGVMKDLPGYKNYYSLKLNRLNNMTPDFFDKVSKGEQVDIVTGELRFQWNDLQDITEADTAEEKKTDSAEAPKEAPR